MKITISIDDVIFAKFKQFCEDNGFKVSTLICVLIRDYLKKQNTPNA